MMSSEFGKGLSYCLGLFLAHTERYKYDVIAYEEMASKTGSDYMKNHAVGLWFNGAADHLFELQCEEAPTVYLASRLARLQSKCLGWRCAMSDEDEPTEKDFRWAIQEAKDLLRLIDKANGVKVVKGDWE